MSFPEKSNAFMTSLHNNNVEIIPFSSDLKEYIKILNIAWLEKYFKVEEKDKLTLSNPQEEIIDKGGMIFYARYNNEILGTASLMKVNDLTFELSKMAVSDHAQGLGVGHKLLEHCINAAKENNAKTLFLYSNTILLPAIHLYKKYGFTEIPLETGVYERADIKMEKIIS
ncbi:Acetyltransferase (GNAT) domain-containing protein [Flavobacterium chilense]|uniref:Acetyltransferase (GNAT) domain-containing protein n=2 Tax=Flavobacterium chilense TaxID=946677 RepID=A0A1M7A7W6_9FLAO|nr:Acetyltransferase (GNAT) domain-containing protein [Flavobacterium chilense]